MRRMEILSIRLEDIDLNRHVIRIREAKAGAREPPITKNLSIYLAEHLKAIASDQEWLFPAKKIRIWPYNEYRKSISSGCEYGRARS